MLKKLISINLLIYLIAIPSILLADSKNFNLWVDDFKKRALSEGISKNVVDEIMSNVRSGMSYSGVRSIKDLQENVLFSMQTNSTNVEGNPHIFK